MSPTSTGIQSNKSFSFTFKALSLEKFILYTISIKQTRLQFSQDFPVLEQPKVSVGGFRRCSDYNMWEAQHLYLHKRFLIMLDFLRQNIPNLYVFKQSFIIIPAKWALRGIYGSKRNNLLNGFLYGLFWFLTLQIMLWIVVLLKETKLKLWNTCVSE